MRGRKLKDRILSTLTFSAPNGRFPWTRSILGGSLGQSLEFRSSFYWGWAPSVTSKPEPRPVMLLDKRDVRMQLEWVHRCSISGILKTYLLHPGVFLNQSLRLPLHVWPCKAPSDDTTWQDFTAWKSASPRGWPASANSGSSTQTYSHLCVSHRNRRVTGDGEKGIGLITSGLLGWTWVWVPKNAEEGGGNDLAVQVSSLWYPCSGEQLG